MKCGLGKRVPLAWEPGRAKSSREPLGFVLASVLLRMGHRLKRKGWNEVSSWGAGRQETTEL